MTAVMLLVCGFAPAKTHKVVKGETFFGIGKQHKVSWKALMSLNGYSDPGTLLPGKFLQIPGTDVKISTRVSVIKPQPKSLHVIIDPGHGGRDPGTIKGGIRESDLNLKVAKRLEVLLKGLGYSVTMTRRTDISVSLERRAQIANRYPNSIFVSIHFNAANYSSVTGVETFFVGSEGKFIAKSVQKGLVRSLKTKNRGIKCKRFLVLRRTVCPAILVECGFISNSYERSRCKTSTYQKKAAEVISKAIEEYYRTFKKGK